MYWFAFNVHCFQLSCCQTLYWSVFWSLTVSINSEIPNIASIFTFAKIILLIYISLEVYISGTLYLSSIVDWLCTVYTLCTFELLPYYIPILCYLVFLICTQSIHHNKPYVLILKSWILFKYVQSGTLWSLFYLLTMHIIRKICFCYWVSQIMGERKYSINIQVSNLGENQTHGVHCSQASYQVQFRKPSMRAIA